jgi:uncharacterized small protein (DUF1192 family)
MARKTRRHPRIRTPRLVASIDAAAERFPGCEVQNLSMGGMLVRTGGRIADGSPVTVEIPGQGARKSLRFGARVVGFDPGVRGVRLQFELDEEEPRSRLSVLLEAFGLKHPEDGRAPKEVAEAPSPTDAGPPPIPPRVAPFAPRATPAAAPAPPPFTAPVEAAVPVDDRVPPRVPPVMRAPPKPAEADGAAGTRSNRAQRQQPVVPVPTNTEAAVDLEEANRRLMVQVKGLLLQLSEAQESVSAQQQEIERLRAELARRDEKSKEH